VLEEVGARVLESRVAPPVSLLLFHPYTRNLIHAAISSKMIAVGWEPGQCSAIHNHRGQECWMGVPIAARGP